MSQLSNVAKEPTGPPPDDLTALSPQQLRALVVGLDARVPVWDGTQVPYVNLDNAATTPAFATVLQGIDRFKQYYSSIHRGTGFKSLLSTHVYDRSREIAAGLIGADLSHHAVLFTCNATYALNKLARRLRLGKDDVVITTLMEHHSNMLPWRAQPCRVVFAGVRPDDGTLDVDDLEAKLRANAGRVKVVAVTGASNVTGSIPPRARIARLAHEHGACFVMDATQLVPHRTVRMGAPDDPERIDFLAFSAHKMYAPFGCGVLAGPKAFFEEGAPDSVGGGTVHAVTVDDVVWHEVPDREEAGTPNVIGALALARAAREYERIGLDALAAHERDVTRHCLERLQEIDGLRVYGRTDTAIEPDRLGVLAIELEGYEHGLLAAILGYEWGIGVRNGCFCAQPYVRELLGVSDAEMKPIVEALAKGDHAAVPGLVRISLGIYNTREEVDYLAEALDSIVRHGPRARYEVHPQHRDYVPEGWDVDFDSYAPI